MYGMQEVLARERCSQLMRDANRSRQARRFVASRRLRRAVHALEDAQANDASVGQRGDYELVGR